MFPNIDHKAVEALLRGQECATSLKFLLENCEISSVLTEPHINTILDSFSLALSFVDSPNPPPYHGHASSSQNMAGPLPQISSMGKFCRGEGLVNYRDDSPIPCPNEGFAWRKYGQKTIKNSPYQRSYYRCAYAKNQNCSATKRVQMIQDDPPVYRTFYFGQHVCKAPTFAVHDGSEMMQCDQDVSEPVMPQLTTIDHQAITMDQDKATDHIMNQECDINDYLVDYDPFCANDQFPPSPSGDTMFLDNIGAFD